MSLERPLQEEELVEVVHKITGGKFLRAESMEGGNMNLARRVFYEPPRSESNPKDESSLIVKQTFSFIYQFQELLAPRERAENEKNFYKSVQIYQEKYPNGSLAQKMPAMLGYDKERSFLVLEDLGRGKSLKSFYQKGRIPLSPLEDILQFLIECQTMSHGVQSLKREQTTNPTTNQNTEGKESPSLGREMVEFHTPYLFEYPFDGSLKDQIMSEDTLLAEAALPLYDDSVFHERRREIQARYQTPGETLLHGDFHLDSLFWLPEKEKVKVIDFEFAFWGDKEWDLATFLAHLLFCPEAREQIPFVLEYYEKETHFRLDTQLLTQFCGIEILRRFLGYAKPDMALSSSEKVELLQRGVEMVKEPTLAYQKFLQQEKS